MSAVNLALRGSLLAISIAALAVPTWLVATLDPLPQRVIILKALAEKSCKCARFADQRPEEGRCWQEFNVATAGLASNVAPCLPISTVSHCLDKDSYEHCFDSYYYFPTSEAFFCTKEEALTAQALFENRDGETDLAFRQASAAVIRYYRRLKSGERTASPPRGFGCVQPAGT